MRDRVLVYNVIGISLFSCVVFHLVIQYGNLDYSGGALSKIGIFGGLAFFMYYIVSRENPLKIIVSKIDLKYIKRCFAVGLGIIGIIWLGYFLAKSLIDFNQISNALLTGGSIDKNTFPYVAIYIAVVNSFLEEVFFRGFIFLQIEKLGYTKIAYIFSAALFALYHITLIEGWFNPLIIILSLVGLFVGGLIFNYLTKKSNSIIGSWIVHGLANVAIISIGVIMFYF